MKINKKRLHSKAKISVCLFLGAVFFLGCGIRYNLKTPPADLKEIQNFKKPVKIAYVGFLPYTAVVTGFSANSYTFRAEVDPSQRMPFSGKVGKPSEEWLDTEKYRKDVPSDRVSKFVGNYLNLVGDSGMQEVKYFTNLSGSIETWKLQDQGIDYYVVGTLSPYFAGDSFFKGLVFGSSIIASMVTLGIIPAYYWEEAAIHVEVYDKNLIRIWEKNYDASFDIMLAIWVKTFPAECKGKGVFCLYGRSIPGKMYHGVIPEIELEVSNLIHRSIAEKK